VISQGTNIMTDISDCTVTAQPPILTSPGLAPLANNGGPTHTHALLPGSPAIDASTIQCTDTVGALLLTDQRGFRRYAFGGTVAFCDIGAYERQVTLSLPLVVR
jgi:hypothetical protein